MSKKCLDERKKEFVEYHAMNPNVYKRVVQLCREMLADGYSHWGIEAAINVLRYLYRKDPSVRKLKMSNNHKAFYARLIMSQERDLEGFFTLHAQTPHQN